MSSIMPIVGAVLGGLGGYEMTNEGPGRKRSGGTVLFTLVGAASGYGLLSLIGRATRPTAPVPISKVSGQLYLGDGALNADWNTIGRRSYAILRYVGNQYKWSPVFVSDAFSARSRVMQPTLKNDGWLFAYMDGSWVRVVGS